MKIQFIFFLLLSVGTAYSQSLSPHPVPEEFASNYFIVTVNGQNIPVFHAGLNVYFASFDFTGEAAVIVTSNYKTKQYSGQTYNKDVIKVGEKGYWGGDVLIRPLSKNVQAKLEGLTASFKLSEPGQYSVERVGTSHFKDDAIFLFANRPDTPLPKTNHPNLIHLKAGIYHRNIDLKTGQTLYLDPGAVLFGAINVWDAKNVSILGRGTVVYYGPQAETRDDGWKHQKNWHPLTTHNVQGLTVRGITFVGRSRTWSLQTHTTFDAVFDNIKVIAVNPQNINGDGIDWYGGGRSKVINSFIRSMDDCFAFFTPDSSQDMWATNKNTTGSVKDIYIENCVLWTTLANVFRIGFSGQALTTDNITMKNCDVLHISQGNWHAPSSLLCMVSPNNQGKAAHSRYLLENIRFEEPTALLGLQNPESSLSKVHFKGISMLGEAIPSLINNQVQGVVFESVFLNGKPVASAADFPLRTGGKGMEAVFVPKK